MKPNSIEKNPYFQLVKTRSRPRDFETFINIFQHRILDQNPSMSAALTFAMVCILLDEDSGCSPADAKFVRKLVDKAARNHPKTRNYILGTVAQWCFAVDDRKWFCSKKPTGKINPEGQEIDVTIYWVRPQDA